MKRAGPISSNSGYVHSRNDLSGQAIDVRLAAVKDGEQWRPFILNKRSELNILKFSNSRCPSLSTDYVDSEEAVYTIKIKVETIQPRLS